MKGPDRPAQLGQRSGVGRALSTGEACSESPPPKTCGGWGLAQPWRGSSGNTGSELRSTVAGHPDPILPSPANSTIQGILEAPRQLPRGASTQCSMQH